MVTDSVSAVTLAQYKRVNYVTQRLTHFLTVKGDPAVYGKVLWQRKIKSHKHCRPYNSVKTHDVLGNHMDVCRPELFKFVMSVILVTQSRDII